MVSLNENIAGVWELHPVVERSTLRRSVVNFHGTSFDSAATALAAALIVRCARCVTASDVIRRHALPPKVQ
jgi:hypothetical protein